MINRDDIEAGDKVYTRDGGCLVARIVEGGLWLGPFHLDYWERNGFLSCAKTRPLDIIRIEKAPKPVVREIYVGWVDGGTTNSSNNPAVFNGYHHIIKLTIINGKLDKAEQVK